MKSCIAIIFAVCLVVSIHCRPKGRGDPPAGRLRRHSPSSEMPKPFLCNQAWRIDAFVVFYYGGNKEYMLGVTEVTPKANTTKTRKWQLDKIAVNKTNNGTNTPFNARFQPCKTGKASDGNNVTHYQVKIGNLTFCLGLGSKGKIVLHKESKCQDTKFLVMPTKKLAALKPLCENCKVLCATDIKTGNSWLTKPEEHGYNMTASYPDACSGQRQFKKAVDTVANSSTCYFEDDAFYFRKTVNEKAILVDFINPSQF
eukprot:m.132994 g.132994  ORF g.132994 m.132994 type:complete len:256 (+) comp38094_c0_seq1:751-1518(+)